MGEEKELAEALANLLAHVERPVDAEVGRVAVNIDDMAHYWRTQGQPVFQEACQEAAAMLRSLAAELFAVREERDRHYDRIGELGDGPMQNMWP